jgi:hypothetical protein
MPPAVAPPAEANSTAPAGACCEGAAAPELADGGDITDTASLTGSCGMTRAHHRLFWLLFFSTIELRDASEAATGRSDYTTVRTRWLGVVPKEDRVPRKILPDISVATIAAAPPPLPRCATRTVSRLLIASAPSVASDLARGAVADVLRFSDGELSVRTA